MASVNSTSSTSSSNLLSSLSGNRYGGLISGLDTDSLVEALVSGTTSKIAKQGQQKQLLQWKQTAYRTAADKLRSFQTKYFNYTANSNTNIMSQGFWNTYKATSSSSKVSATVATGATATSVTISSVQQLATAESLSSKLTVSPELTLSKLKAGQNVGTDAFTGKTLKLDVNGTLKTVKLDDLNAFIDGDGTLNFSKTIDTGKVDGEGDPITQNFEQKLQELLDKAFTTKRVYDEETDTWSTVSNVEVSTAADGSIKLDSQTSKIIVAEKSTFLGVDESDSNRINLKTKIGSAISGLQGDTLTFSINGTKISVGKNETLTDLMNKINTGDTGVTMTYSSSTDEFILTSKTTGGGENIVVEDVYGNLMNQLFGAKSSGGVGTGYLTTAGTATSQGMGTLFNTLNNSASGSADMKALGSSLKYMSFEMTIDGVKKTVTVDSSQIKASDLSAGTFTASDVYNAINKGIKNAFTGTSVQLGAQYGLYDNESGQEIDLSKVNDKGYIIYKDKDNVEHYLDSNGYEVDADGKTIYDNGERVSFATSKSTGLTNIYSGGSAVTIESGGVMKLLGFTEPTGNVATGSTKLNELANSTEMTGGTLTINGVGIAYTAGMTVDSLLDAINNDTTLAGSVKASFTDGKLTIDSVNGSIDIKDTGSMLKDIFGITGPYKTEAQSYAEGAHKEGKNAEVVIDGQVHSYSSNTFTMNGINITLNAVSEANDAPIVLGVVSDVDDVVNRVKGWIEDYNAMIYSLNSMINESKNNDYSPLTDEQRSEMTEDQITKWETEAKKGVLRNDNTLRSILAELRQSMYEKVESAGISLYDIGITTKAYGYTDPNEAGQLCFDEIVAGGGEAKLRAMLESDPDKVRLLFTDENNGLAVKMNNIITKAVKKSSVDRGSLVTLAGTEELTGDNTSTIGKKISAIDEYIAKLKTRLESEYNRYWKKFTALETSVQKLNSQSAMFTTE